MKKYANFVRSAWSFEFWLLVLLSIGFVVVLGVSIPLNIDNVKLFTVPYRIVICIISIYIIYKNFTWKKFLHITCIFFVLFWLYYLTKLQYSLKVDYYTEDFQQAQLERIVRIFVIILIPGLALLLIDYTKVNLAKLGGVIYKTLFIMLALNLLYGVAVYAGQNYLPHIFYMYYIWAGHLGTSLAILSLFYLLFLQKENNTKLKYFYISGFILGVVSIITLRARSPFLALFLVGLYLILVRQELRLLLWFFVLSIVSLIAIYWYGSQDPESIHFFGRMYRWLFQGDTSLREPLFERGMDIFKNNPIFGGRVLYEDGYYPHNLFIELLMATGLVGLVLFLLQYSILIRAYKNFIHTKYNIYYILFFALFLQYFILKMTSGNLINSYFIHYSCIVLGLSLSYVESNERENHPTL